MCPARGKRGGVGEAAWKGPWRRGRGAEGPAGRRGRGRLPSPGPGSGAAGRPRAARGSPVSSPGASPPASRAATIGPRRSLPQQASAGLPLSSGGGGTGVLLLLLLLSLFPFLLPFQPGTRRAPPRWGPRPCPSPSSPTPPPVGLPKPTSRVGGDLGGIAESGRFSGLEGLSLLPCPGIWGILTVL